ncbi:TetR/AcrR family transcriptional regulator [Pseudomonas lactis]|jgi:AcrR family transcriptional regulator|nr:TetR/AcrR family transcriptional regulator [Pseudomonas lactis]
MVIIGQKINRSTVIYQSVISERGATFHCKASHLVYQAIVYRYAESMIRSPQSKRKCAPTETIDDSSRPTPNKRKRMPPQEREREIIEEAVRFFAEVGFEGTLRELAERLGITHQNLFRYFATKEALIDRVYQEVYLSRWQPEWEAMLKQPGKTLEARLIDFYKAYLPAIFRYDWVRIFIFAGLKGVDISQRYLSLIQTKVIEPVAMELRELSCEKPPGETLSSAELEVAWGLHGELFYLAQRRWVYDMTVPEDLDRFIEISIIRFLHGAPAAMQALTRDGAN